MSTHVKYSVIIAAGGSGSRMGAQIPKQFLLLNDKPIIFHTIQKFVDALPDIEIIVVLPEYQQKLWHQLVDKHQFNHEVKLAIGGEQRYHSVKAGLALATGDVIGVHDAVRPLIDKNVIKAVYEQAANTGAAVPVVELTDSIRKITYDESEAVNRKEYRLVQTPQVFKSNIIKIAYEQKYHPNFTDDATVVEACGHDIVLVEGNVENIKITRPVDLVLAAALLSELS
ncbi:2-C-methyl-D-erythritol 4-phosphate cytidylyltransferase [Paracrocinitomix mangrovi]|uniref:2-C-methyl-D-erythritol 4-phosphate cytidylyltransferase n=1 Tax=Paracrocinitomix mangrovi TaxID=2862509 RepID=UPI001C8D0539|nr:2-C-methyl-D-erythritol 4-phosphate cytidylyltransferase [Paracrocinitomix mangrovi]UKN03542.1 2-C-methyl-D-erythritol 4-phosphate cytidylyltransferase [Paracrocinitomix mangrovi]